VQNDEVRQTTKQLLSKYGVSLFGHIAQMPDKTDAKKILTTSPQRRGQGWAWGGLSPQTLSLAPKPTEYHMLNL